ncbi:hypothetical protein GCM10020331_059460 [Ectobacillus funiculus]
MLSLKKESIEKNLEWHLEAYSIAAFFSREERYKALEQLYEKGSNFYKIAAARQVHSVTEGIDTLEYRRLDFYFFVQKK